VPAHSTDLRWSASLRSQLAFKHTDQVTADKGYAGPVVVCSVRYEPIAGHRASTARLSNTFLKAAKWRLRSRRLRAPACCCHSGVSVVSMLANLVIEANRFEATSQPPDASAVADPKAR
jgi:hypothetical protein